ncbi:MAG: hypothetical protein AB8F74_09540 [Saprospiraceae bacterium]
MQLNLSDKEFKTLLEITFYADAILNSIHEKKEFMSPDVLAFKQKIYDMADDSKLSDWIDDANPDDLELTSKKEEALMDNLFRYEEAVFWENLVDKLVERDMIKKYNLGNVKRMSTEELVEKEQEFRTKYYESFQRMGVKKLILKR